MTTRSFGSGHKEERETKDHEEKEKEWCRWQQPIGPVYRLLFCLARRKLGRAETPRARQGHVMLAFLVPSVLEASHAQDHHGHRVLCLGEHARRNG